MPRVSATERLLAAIRFAAERHHGQTIHGSDAVPYVAHVLEVAERLAQHHPEDAVLILGGILHDVLEDTETGDGELRERFGSEVTDLVGEVTDEPGLTERERRAAQVAHARHASAKAKRLKLADKAANLREMVTHPWHPTVREATAYIDWACAVIDPIRGLDPALEAEFDAAVDAARAAVGRRT